MKNIKSPFIFFKEISESVSAGNRENYQKLALKNSYIFDHRINYNHEALIKDLYILLDKAVLTKTAVMSIIGRHTKEESIESIAKLTKMGLRSLIGDLNLLLSEKERMPTQMDFTPDGKIHYGECLNKKTKEKGDLYYDPLDKNWIFVDLDGKEMVFNTSDSFIFPKNS